MRVLLVDDEPRIVSALERMMTELADEWDVEIADSGLAALGALGSDAFDVVVTDMRMPGMDGVELLGEIHARWPQMMRVVLSGHTEQEQAMRALASAHQFMSKPCAPQLLVDAVQRASCRVDRIGPRLAEMAARIDRLPSRPSKQRELSLLLADPRSDDRKIIEIIATDPGHSAKVLQVASSPYFRRGQEFRDVRGAVARLGRDAVRSIVASEGVTTLLPAHRTEELHTEALCAAVVAARVAPSNVRREAFSAGLLSSVGMLVLEECALEERRSKYADVGAYLLALWGLPDEIVEAVGLHRTPEDAPTALRPIVDAVHVGHHVALGTAIDEGRLPSPKRTELDEVVRAIRCGEVP
jgi:HD-like signal output (HDOD) protein/CheY-like chemotaxis protein